ncbi:MAG: 4Fe-4S dicluster domain-containing protein [Candidatus Marinimicrobia bacterium]|jgi:heterodisulfide reductase subunit C|nr:4Fe-4S dicluster domain-containing protein [Candidatus Neomarinimicrobiota bacterium]
MIKNEKLNISSQEINSEENKSLRDISEVNVYSCYQCGNCSSGCPAVEFMDIPPNQIIRYLQLGKINKVLESKTPWICAACNYCSAKCPRSVDITKVMEGLRRIILRKGIDHVDINELKKELLHKLPPIALISNFRKFVL